MADAHLQLTPEQMQVLQQNVVQQQAEVPAQPDDDAAIQARAEYFAASQAEPDSDEPNAQAAALLLYYQMQASGIMEHNKAKKHRPKKKTEDKETPEH